MALDSRLLHEPRLSGCAFPVLQSARARRFPGAFGRFRVVGLLGPEFQGFLR